jgi:hypothetical protein
MPRSIFNSAAAALLAMIAWVSGCSSEAAGTAANHPASDASGPIVPGPVDGTAGVDAAANDASSDDAGSESDGPMGSDDCAPLDFAAATGVGRPRGFGLAHVRRSSRATSPPRCRT